MDTTQWPQGIGIVKHMESSRPMLDQRKARPRKDQALKCPRCNSTNTKFCYYNNYSLSQPRYFCKTCRRYWTEGGSLRNVPVGGGSRKNRRSASSSTKVSDLTPPSFSQSASQNPKIHAGQDLNLAFQPIDQDHNSMTKFVQARFDTVNNSNKQSQQQNPGVSCSTNSSSGLSTLDFHQKPGFPASSGLGSFIATPVPNSNALYSTAFSTQEFKPSLNFPLDGFESGYENLQPVHESRARVLFPTEDLKPVPNSSEYDQSKGQEDSNGFWHGMIGGGSW